jgi:hypothetical protein
LRIARRLVGAPAPVAVTDERGHERGENPLTPSLGLNLQDSYIGSYYDLGDADSNTLLLRGAMPHKLGGVPQIVRATLPVVTTPDIAPSGRHTDLGDLNVFDLFLRRAGAVELGIGVRNSPRPPRGATRPAPASGRQAAPASWSRRKNGVCSELSSRGNSPSPVTLNAPTQAACKSSLS